MKLATARWNDEFIGPGIVLNDQCILDLRHSPFDQLNSSVDMLAVINHWSEFGSRLQDWSESVSADRFVTLEAVKLEAPILNPPQIRDFACFEQHVRQARRSFANILGGGDLSSGESLVPESWYKQPLYYKCNRFAVCGPNTEIQWPSNSSLMDYELELAAIIGKPGKNITAEEARDHIFGFTIFNDFSARDTQLAEMSSTLGPSKSKDFDNANAFGPWIVTADELGDPRDLEMIVRVNGEERSRGHSSDMHWSFERLIEFISRDETIHTGEILGSGTVGNGCGLELMQFLEDGDEVELEIERIGNLTNSVARCAEHASSL